MTKDEALDLALEFFETMQRYKGTRSNIFIRFEPTATGDYVDLREFDGRAKPIITAIKQARSAPTVQEPVGEVVVESMGVRGSDAMRVRMHFYKEIPPVGSKIYTTPPAQPAPVQERELAGFVMKDGIPVAAVFSDGSHAVSVDGFTWTEQPAPEKGQP